MSDDDFEKRVAEELRADSRTESVLPILEEQINILIKEGQTNLTLFLASLESNSVMPSEEVSELRAKFGLEAVGPNPFSRLLLVNGFNNGL